MSGLWPRIFDRKNDRALRELRSWLEGRGYTSVKLPLAPALSYNEELTGSLLTISISLDRSIDWYVDLKPLEGDLDFRPLEGWMRCIGSTADPGIRLRTLADALRANLANIEAACEPARLSATIACLSRS